MVASPIELLVDADAETVEPFRGDPTDPVAADLRPFGGNALQFVPRILRSSRRSGFSGGELLLQLLDLRAIQERGISANGRAQFIRRFAIVRDARTCPPFAVHV